MINLNDDSFAGSKNVSIFNDGNAGTVENVTVTVVKKTGEDKDSAPDYKLVWTDNSGATTNSAYWYVNEATQYSTVDEQIKKQGKVLRHAVKAIYGSDFQFPEYANQKEMLDGAMKLIRDGAQGNTYRVFANYGTTSYPKGFIQVRSWTPFIEPMTKSAEDSSLKSMNIDAMDRLTEDAPVAAVTADDGDDW